MLRLGRSRSYRISAEPAGDYLWAFRREATLRRLPDLKVDLSAAQRYPSLGQVNGYSTLPATFTPSEPVGESLPLDN